MDGEWELLGSWCFRGGGWHAMLQLYGLRRSASAGCLSGEQLCGCGAAAQGPTAHHTHVVCCRGKGTLLASALSNHLTKRGTLTSRSAGVMHTVHSRSRRCCSCAGALAALHMSGGCGGALGSGCRSAQASARGHECGAMVLKQACGHQQACAGIAPLQLHAPFTAHIPDA